MGLRLLERSRPARSPACRRCRRCLVVKALCTRGAYCWASLRQFPARKGACAGPTELFSRPRNRTTCHPPSSSYQPLGDSWRRPAVVFFPFWVACFLFSFGEQPRYQVEALRRPTPQLDNPPAPLGATRLRWILLQSSKSTSFTEAGAALNNRDL